MDIYYSSYHFVIKILYYDTISYEKILIERKKRMQISKTLQKAVKEEGKSSLTSKTIVKLKNSKEFDYLVDKNR